MMKEEKVMEKIFAVRNRRRKLLLASILLLFSVQVVWAELQQHALLDLLIKKDLSTVFLKQAA